VKFIPYATYLLIFLHFARLAIKRVRIKKYEPWKPLKIDTSKYKIKQVLYYKTPTSGGRLALVQWFRTSGDCENAWKFVKSNYNDLIDGMLILNASEKLEDYTIYIETDHPHIFSLRHALASAFPDAPIESVRLKS
jgi:hypothetical protein